MRVRALVGGLLLCAGISVGIPYGEFVIQGTSELVQAEQRTEEMQARVDAIE